MTDALLSVRDLSIAFRSGGHETLAVNRISFDIPKGETLALVSESAPEGRIHAAGPGLVPPIRETVFDDFYHAKDPYEEHGSFEIDGTMIFFQDRLFRPSPHLPFPRSSRSNGDRAGDHDHARRRVLIEFAHHVLLYFHAHVRYLADIEMASNDVRFGGQADMPI